MPPCRRSISQQRLPEEVRARVERHPCFCEDASHFYARIHLPVAPACNVQCNFCNRKYDCSNETRPGVTSKIISPAEALERVRYVYAKLPHLAVVGIAGPGDPLANPNETFSALEMVKTNFPELKLCISTNGLALPEYIPVIASLGIEHVTISIMAVDPEISSKIYRWVKLDNQVLRGLDGSKAVLLRQIEGLRKLVERGILVKINVVNIPGINDVHIPILAEKVKEMGATMLNILSFIPVKGSAFELLRAPTSEETLLTREIVSKTIHLVHHCQQCRADAVGMLGEDLSTSLSLIPFPQAVSQSQSLSENKLEIS
jgi:nitrogen fixation protein NifB